MHQDEHYLKEALIETLVEYKVIDYHGNQRYGKSFDCKLVITEPRLDCYVKQMHKKTKTNYTDFYNDCIFRIIEVINEKFVPQYGWQVLIDRSNKKAFNQLIKFLKNYIKKQALEGYVCESGYHTTENVKLASGETRQRNVYVSTNFSSIDATIYDKEKQAEVTVSETVEHGFWEALNDTSKANNFLEWYRNNRERFLTKKQCVLLDTLEYHGYCKEDKKAKEMHKESGIDSRNLSTKLKTIENRILNAWDKERKFVEASFIEKTITKKISLLQIYLDLYDDDEDVNVKQNQLSNFVRAHADSLVIESLMDKLPHEDYLEVVRAIQTKTVIAYRILYKFYRQAEKSIEQLQLSLAKEQAIREKLSQEQGIVLPKDKRPISTSSLYLHLDSYGNLHDKTKK